MTSSIRKRRTAGSACSVVAAVLLAVLANPAGAQLGTISPAESDIGKPRPASGDPAALNKCLRACRAGGRTITVYCGTMPTPQLKAMCHAAAAAGEASCYGFCYARFVD